MARENPILQRTRRDCLALPESHEVASWGHPNFQAGRRTFLAFEWIGGRPSIAFRLDPADVHVLLRKRGFFVTPYGQGRWVSVWADRKINQRLVSHLIERSYRLVALKRMAAVLDERKNEAL